jgi:hypothetical protein
VVERRKATATPAIRIMDSKIFMSREVLMTSHDSFRDRVLCNRIWLVLHLSIHGVQDVLGILDLGGRVMG